MKNQEKWELFEALSRLDADDPKAIEMRKRIEGDDTLRDAYDAFATLQEWGQREMQIDYSEDRAKMWRRLASENREVEIEREMGRLFPLVVGGALAACLLVALLNLWQYGDTSGGVIEAFFGLPSEELETAIVTQL